MAAQECGVFVYFEKKVSLHHLQQVKLLRINQNSVKMDPREYGIGAQILRALGVRKINLVSRVQPQNIGLKGFDLEIVSVTLSESETVSVGETVERVLN
jgi:3,4-dihydroxy 2-butanone 4-phosphate synthase/GTP cyclohydrolase II